MTVTVVFVICRKKGKTESEAKERLPAGLSQGLMIVLRLEISLEGSVCSWFSGPCWGVFLMKQQEFFSSGVFTHGCAFLRGLTLKLEDKPVTQWQDKKEAW